MTQDKGGNKAFARLSATPHPARSRPSKMNVHWTEMFAFTVAPLEIFLRGSFVYLFIFAIFRFVLRRDVGAVGIADVLILVLIADASQNAMAAEYKSVSDGFVLIGTLVSWSYAFDFLSFRFRWFRGLVEAGPLCLVRDGRKLYRNMRREYVTDEELDAKLRGFGVGSLEEVERAYLETDGAITVIKKNRG